MQNIFLDDAFSGFSEQPYPGLRPFTRNEADIFFGRQQQIVQLLNKLESHRFLAVVGTSGSGKSSLVRAGLIPALEAGIMASAGSRWISATMRPGSDPVGNLAQAILGSHTAGQTWRRYPDAHQLMIAVLRRGPNGIAELLNESQFAKGTNLVLLVDQFEEIFRFHRQGEINQSIEFIELLLQAHRQTDQRVYVVLTMRSDFLGDCSLYTGLPEAINDGQFLVPRLTREQCHEAIVGPAAAFDIDVKEELVTQILNDLRGDSDQLPLMQHALMRMWLNQKRNTDGSRPVFTRQLYERVGGVENALSNHADEVYTSLNLAQQKIASTIFRCLTERGTDQRDTRRPVCVEELVRVVAESQCDSGIEGGRDRDAPATTINKAALTNEVLSVIDVFRDSDCSFLVPSQPVFLTNLSIIDISHESLIRQWRRLIDWVVQEYTAGQIYKRMLETAELWSDGKAALWRTPDLESGLSWQSASDGGPAWADRYGGNYTLAIKFLHESEKDNQQQKLENESRVYRELTLTKKAARRLRLALCSSLALCAIAVFAAISGYILWQQQSNLRSIAIQSATNAENQESIAKQSLEESHEHLWVSRRHEANALVKTNLIGHRIQSLAILSEASKYRNTLALRNEAFACMLLTDCEHAKSKNILALGPDPVNLGKKTSRHISTDSMASAKGREVEITQAGEVRTLSHPSTVESVLWSPSGRFLVTGCLDAFVYVWHIESGNLISALPHAGRVTRLCFNPSGTVLLTVSYDGFSRLWDPISGEVFLVMHFGVPYRFDSTGTKLVNENGVAVHDLVGMQDVRMLHHGEVGNRGQVSEGIVNLLEVCFSKDSRFICSSGDDGVCVWDVQTGAQLQYFKDSRSGSGIFLDNGDLCTHGSRGLMRHKFQDGDNVIDGLPQRRRWSEGDTLFSTPNHREFLQHKSATDASSSTLVLVEPTNDRARVVNLLNPSEIIDLGPQIFCWCAAIDPMGKIIVTTSWAWNPPEDINIWDRKTGKLVTKIGEDPYASCVFSPNGLYAVFGSQTKYTIRDSQNWKVEKTFPRSSNVPGHAAFSHDGMLLGILKTDSELQLISTQSWTQVLSIRLPENPNISRFQFSPDGKHLAMLSGPRRVALRDLSGIRMQMDSLGLAWQIPSL